MKRLIGFLIVTSFLMLPLTAEAGFDDFLKDVLVETSNQAIGGNSYQFAPGDTIIKQNSYAVFYSGTERISGTTTLLLTVMTSQGSIILKYPNPDIIRVKDYQLKILGFDNTGIRLQVLRSNTV